VPVWIDLGEVASDRRDEAMLMIRPVIVLASTSAVVLCVADTGERMGIPLTGKHFGRRLVGLVGVAQDLPRPLPLIICKLASWCRSDHQVPDAALWVTGGLRQGGGILKQGAHFIRFRLAA
jgi:hypothetical protein